MATQPETNFKKKVKRYLDQLAGCWYVKTQFAAIVGIPDILGCYRGRFFAWELKKDRKSDASAIQKRVIQAINNCGGIARVVNPSNLDDMLKELIQTASLLH